jgi:hypothetical protein
MSGKVVMTIGMFLAAAGACAQVLPPPPPLRLHRPSSSLIRK